MNAEITPLKALFDSPYVSALKGMTTLELFELSGDLPCRLIHRAPGKRYLERYHLGEHAGHTFYLHRFVEADKDEETHDHPWHAATLVLKGGYLEETLHSVTVNDLSASAIWQREGDSHELMGGGLMSGSFHRIMDAEPETWTLFCHGQRLNSWGFLRTTERGFEYVNYKHAISSVPEPFDGAYKVDWPIRAPLGKDTDRAPLGEDYAQR